MYPIKVVAMTSSPPHNEDVPALKHKMGVNFQLALLMLHSTAL
jgi:hypothetical protein